MFVGFNAHITEQGIFSSLEPHIIYLYKKGYPDVIGIEMRKAYEEGRVRNAYEFEEVLKDVLCSCKR